MKKISATEVSVLWMLGKINARKEVDEWLDQYDEMYRDEVTQAFERVLAFTEKEIETIIGRLPSVDIPTEPDVDNSDPMNPENYKRNHSYSLRSLHGGSQSYSWLNKTGSSFGGPALVVFNNSKSKFFIPDASKMHGNDGNTNNHRQMFYFSGNPAQQRDTNSGCPGGCASVFSAPNSGDTSFVIYFEALFNNNEQEFSDLPELAPDAVPKEDILIGDYSMKPYTRTPGNGKSAGRVSRDFNKHNYPVKFVFNNGCGEFTIPTAAEDFLKNGKEHYAFLKWEKGSPVVFTKAGCVASRVTAYKVI